MKKHYAVDYKWEHTRARLYDLRRYSKGRNMFVLLGIARYERSHIKLQLFHAKAFGTRYFSSGYKKAEKNIFFFIIFGNKTP